MSVILLSISRPENRRLLREWLAQHYEVVEAESACPPEISPDLHIVDAAALRACEPGILARKQKEAPLFAPVLMTTQRRDVGLATKRLWKTVDEIIVAPIHKTELQARVHLLLEARRLSLELRRQDEKKLADILRNITDSFIMLDNGWRITYANPQAARVRQAAWETLLGKLYWEEQKADKEVEKKLRRAALKNKPASFERRLLKKGREVWLEIHVYPAQDGMAVFERDISERKRAEQSLRRFNQIQSGLVRLGNALAAASDLISSCRAAYLRLQEMIDCPCFGVSLFDPHTSLLHPAYVNADGQEIDVSPIPPLRYDPAQATGGRALAIASQKAVIVNDLIAKTRAAKGMLLGDSREPDSAIYVPMIVEGKVIGLMELQSYLPRAYAPKDGEWLAVAANQIGLGLQNARLLEETRRSRDRLAELSRRLAAAREAESRAIGRELHDQIGQTLTALKLTLDMLPQAPPESVPQKLAMAQNLADELLTHVRRMSLELRPPMLDDLGLIPTLLWHVHRYQEQTNIAVDFKHSGAENRRFSPEAETAAYRIIQEALTNIARHAQTSRVTLKVHASEETLEITIQDFGRGFDLQAKLQKQTSSGLRGMEERARLLNGTFEIQSEPSQGTLLKITLPL